ncbi:MAG: hypothetical protein ACOYXA_09050 [Bacteroidota bacterium]
MQNYTRLIFLLFGLSSSFAYSQPTIPVDLLTGRAQVTIPIWSLSQGPYSTDVFIANNGNGVRATEGEGTVGVGWNLIAGGSVSREVRGLPDDYNGDPQNSSDLRRGWLVAVGGETPGAAINSFTSSADNDVSTSGCTDETADWNFINAIDNKKDTEPDIFSFDAPGLSGQFVFNHLGQPVPIPYQDIKIEVSGLPIHTIAITKNDGTKYTFNIGDKIVRRAVYHEPASQGLVVDYYTQRELWKHYTSFISSWKLSSFGGNGNTITFQYDSPQSAITGGAKDYVVVYKKNGANVTTDTTYYFHDQTVTRRLLSITTLSQKVELSWFTYPLILNKIGVVDRITGTRKEFYINYVDVKNPNATFGQSARKFLKSIKESNSNCYSFPSYEFEYYNVSCNAGFLANATTTHPFHDQTTKQDHFGYFNDWATDVIPKVFFYAGGAGAERYRFYPMSGQTLSNSINTSSNRDVNPATVASGSLKSIKYPTNGMAVISYEPNTYFDTATGQDQYGPGVRVSQVATYDSIGMSPVTTTEYDYLTSDNKSSGKWIYRTTYGFHDMSTLCATNFDNSPDSRLMYSRVITSQSGRGKVITEYNLPAMSPSLTESEFPLWNATETKVVRGSCINVGYVLPGYYQMPFAPSVNFDFERGLVSRIATYDINNQLKHEKIFSYQYLNLTPTEVKGLRYNMLNATIGINTPSARVYVFSVYKVLTNIGKVLLTETSRLYDMNDPTKFVESGETYTFNTTHHLLSHVTSTASDQRTWKTKFKYAKDFETLTNPNSSDKQANALKAMNSNFMHGTLIESIQSVAAGSEQITGGSVTLFDRFYDSLGVPTYVWPTEVKRLGSPTGFVESTVLPQSGSNQQFIHSANYFPVTSMLDYDFRGNALSMLSGLKTYSSYHLGYGFSRPVAKIANARAGEVLYDGFESYSGFGLNVLPVSSSYVDGWSGKKALQISSGTTIERTSVQKGLGRYYRYSFRLKAATSSSITLKIWQGLVEKASITVNYESPVNSWRHFEGLLDMNSVTGSFRVTIQANAQVTFDDLLLHPEGASVSLATYEPLYGITSETDERGNSSFLEYDVLGRLRYVKDQDKTLRQQNDYYYASQDTIFLSATFTASKEPYQVRVDPATQAGTQVIFTAPANCISPVNYEWFVNGVSSATASTFTYTFSVAQKYVVMLRVSSALGSNSYSREYDVQEIGSGPLRVNVSTSSGSYAFCDPDHSKTFFATLTGCFMEQDVEVTWYYNIGGGWLPFIAGSGSGTFSNNDRTLLFNPLIAFNGIGNLSTYSIRCEVTGSCPTDTGQDIGKIYISVDELNISYNGNTQCE